MTTSTAFIAMLVLAAASAVAVLRFLPTHAPAPVRASATAQSAPAAPAVAAETVLAAHPATFALALALASRGTRIEVIPAWPAVTPWGEQAEFARAAPAEWQATARRAAVVVTLRHAAPDDALFAAVRERNPRVVELDASVAADRRTPSVRLRAGTSDTSAVRENNGTSFALSPSNAMQLAERIAADFTALYPDDGSAIADNLRALKERLLRLKAQFEQKLALVAAPEVAVFSDRFDYLCEEFGVQIVARIEKDFAQWTDADRATYADRLQRSGARTSLHAFAPGAELAAWLRTTNVEPLSLDALTTSTAEADAYFRALEKNLAALTRALER